MLNLKLILIFLYLILTVIVECRGGENDYEDFKVKAVNRLASTLRESHNTKSKFQMVRAVLRALRRYINEVRKEYETKMLREKVAYWYMRRNG
jgi:hypothetical protein